jgi:purine-binding chemotaxis protein CheW
MAQHLDQKMLTGFVREAQDYLPQLRESITSFQQEPNQREALEEACRYAHTIKGASAMVGLPTLSHVAGYVETTLEEVVSGRRRFDTMCYTWVFRTADHIHQYLEGLLAGDMQQQGLVTEVVQDFRRFRQLPPSGDAAAVATVMDDKVDLIGLPVPGDVSNGSGPHAIPEFDAMGSVMTDDPALLDDEAVEAPSDTSVAEPVARDIAPEVVVPQAQAPVPPRPSQAPQAPDALQTLLSQIDEDVQQAYSQDAMAVAPSGMLPHARQTDRYIVFTLGGSRYAVPVPYVLEIGRVPRITPVPNVPAWVRGVINLRGDILSVIDFRLFLGLEDHPPTEHSRMLVVKTGDDEMTTSLIVDHIAGIVPLAASRMALPASVSSHKAASYLAGAYEHDNQVCAVFDLERLLASPEVRQFE